MSTTEQWTDASDEHDYPAVEDYLSLLTTQDAAHNLAARLQSRRFSTARPRTCAEPVLCGCSTLTNVHVAKDLATVKKGKRSHRSSSRTGSSPRVALIVADGYHGMCASNRLNKDADMQTTAGVVAQIKMAAHAMRVHAIGDAGIE